MELETFKITVLPLREKLINISWRMMEDRSDAEDIVQETFLKLWQIREKLDGYNSVEALAVQVAKNLALDKLKQHRPEGMDIALLSLDSGTRNPAEELEQHDTVARIRWLISKLPSLQQTIIRMKDVEGYETVGTSSSSSKKSLSIPQALAQFNAIASLTRNCGIRL